MSTRSWLRAYRKQITIHTLIVAAFLVFLLFLAEPLFDRFESIEGESRLHDISLPTVTNNIQGHIDTVDIYTHTIEITGWAFINGGNSENSETYLVLQSDDNTYVFDTVSRKRLPVVQKFWKVGIKLVDPGFNAIIPVRKIARGTYILGLYITEGNIEALQYYPGKVVEF